MSNYYTIVLSFRVLAWNSAQQFWVNVMNKYIGNNVNDINNK